MDELDRETILLRFLCEAAEDRLERVWTATEMLRRFPKLMASQGMLHPLPDGPESEPSLAREQQPRPPAKTPPRRRKAAGRYSGSIAAPGSREKPLPGPRRKPVT